MRQQMSIRRIVPNIQTSRTDESREFYSGFLGLEVEMDMGWIVTFVSEKNPTAQLSVITSDLTASVHPDLTIEVDNLDELYTKAVQRDFEIVYPLTEEPWGVRRFFVRDPNGKVLNLMMHIRQ
jgi:catechol 2,3-dioxygenase-like lactoylglutathione lyase family enzyme